MNHENQEVTNADILEFLQEHMIVKADFDTRIGGIETRLDKVETRLDKVETRLDTMNVKLESLDSRFAEFQAELEDIKMTLAAIETKLKEDTDALNNVLITEVTQLKKRVAFLEHKLGLKGFDFNGASI